MFHESLNVLNRLSDYARCCANDFASDPEEVPLMAKQRRHAVKILVRATNVRKNLQPWFTGKMCPENRLTSFMIEVLDLFGGSEDEGTLAQTDGADRGWSRRTSS